MIDEVFDLLVEKFGGRGFMIVHGACKGADKLAALAAERRGVRTEAHPVAAVDWGRYGKAAGPIRNRKMLSLGADLVVAFPGGRGTEDMAERAEHAGVELWRPGNWLDEEVAVDIRSRGELLLPPPPELNEDEDTIVDVQPSFDFDRQDFDIK